MKPRNAMTFVMAAIALATLTAAGPGFAAPINVMNANVTHGLTGQGVEQPFGAIKVCVPGTKQCQTINHLLIDTGSFGLRIFSQALTVHLPVETSGPDRVAECAFFGSLTAWGRIATADVTMGGEPTIQKLPVQIINPNFPVAGGLPSGCSSSGQPIARSPQQVNFKGILGVGMLQSDGGFGSNYYACTTTTCTPITQPPELQVQNPVALLPKDNNGVMLKFPPPPTNGASALTGQLIFGINTRANNKIPTAFKVYTADANLNFTTVFKTDIPRIGFIDSGSNGYFYEDPTMPLCPRSSPWYCPAGLTPQKAVNTGSDGLSMGTFNFAIANANSLFRTGNAAYYDLGANVVGPGTFDWGLPFFLGRRVFVGIAGKPVTGISESPPFWAYATN